VTALISKVIIDEKIGKEIEVLKPESEYFERPYHFARDKLLFCRCSACSTIMFGGRLACGDLEMPAAYVCTACRGLRCGKHGEGGMVFKCFFCCTPASWFCFGTTDFCERCHNEYVRTKGVVTVGCNGGCLFPGHPPNGTQRRFGYCAQCLAVT
jgi:hypothetical protein